MEDIHFGTAIASVALVSALMRKLREKGIVSDQDVTDVIDSALLMTEARQNAAPQEKEAFEAARRMIEMFFQRPAL